MNLAPLLTDTVLSRPLAQSADRTGCHLRARATIARERHGKKGGGGGGHADGGGGGSPLPALHQTFITLTWNPEWELLKTLYAVLEKAHINLRGTREWGGG